MKRHAYLILAHKNPRQLRKLIALLDDPRNDIFVHVDRKGKYHEMRAGPARSRCRPGQV